jgi:hypothetical protein
MERRFDMSDFEQSLKAHADQFKLMPSKRVWNGIYNDLHPGSRWPSISIGIIFLITLVTIGNLNNHSNKTVDKQKTAFLSSAKTEMKGSESTKNTSTSGINTSEETLTTSRFKKNSIEKNSSKSTNKSLSSSEDVKINVTKNSGTDVKKTYANNGLNHLTAKVITTKTVNNSLETVASKNDNQISNENAKFILENENEILPSIVSAVWPVSFKTEIPQPLIENISSTLEELNLSGEENLQNSLVGKTECLTVINENKAINIKKAFRKNNKNTEWVFYVTPNITTVSFDHKTIRPLASGNSSSIVVLPNQPASSLELIPNARIGFEAGAEVKTLVAKKLKVVTGFNLNYSSYNTISNIVHPTIATLLLTNKYGTYSKDYITYYGNGQTESHTVSLRNYSVQLSLPIGFEYTIWGNKKVAIDVQSVIEPSAVLASNAYLLSSDGRYYVTDPSLMRKINLGGNFGSFVSFSSHKIRWHIGPDIRYQFLSSYKNNYSTKEHFIDYGIRIGLSRVK